MLFEFMNATDFKQKRTVRCKVLDCATITKMLTLQIISAS